MLYVLSYRNVVHVDHSIRPIPNEADTVPGAVSNLDRRLQTSSVYSYSRHYCISHPGDETYAKISRLISEQLISSVDVEAGPIQRAVLQIRRSCPSATFTPIYICSDDPRSGKQNRFNMLAYGGPLHENWKPDPRLGPLLRALIDLSFRCWLAERGREKRDAHCFRRPN